VSRSAACATPTDIGGDILGYVHSTGVQLVVSNGVAIGDFKVGTGAASVKKSVSKSEFSIFTIDGTSQVGLCAAGGVESDRFAYFLYDVEWSSGVRSTSP